MINMKETKMPSTSNLRGHLRGKNFLITGIQGFVGGNLAKALLAKQANVFGLVRDKKPGRFISFEGMDDQVSFISGDLCDKELLERIITEEKINYIYHLAAQVEVGVGLTNPYLTFETNVRGTYTVLEAARRFPETVEAIVVASSDKAYGSYPREQMPYQEDYPLQPRYPYDTSKAAADLIARSYATEIYNLPIVVTRFCNIYGPGQLNFSALIPDGITSAQGYTHFEPRGDGTQIRDFIYVEDVADLYLKIAADLSENPSLSGEIYNAGTKTPVSVREVLETIFKLVGNNTEFERIAAEMSGKKTTGEIDVQFMDYKKVEAVFGWRPVTSLEEGLAKTINWFARFNEERFEGNK